MTDKKQRLKEIQRLLASVGLYQGAIDGLIGFKTYNAIIGLGRTGYKGKQASDIKNTSREIQKILVDEKLYFGAIDGIFGNGSMSALNHLIPAPKVTEDMLKRLYATIASGFAAPINKHMESYGIKTKAELCAFLANVVHESNGFKRLRENMNYSAKRLTEVWPSRFKTLAYAQEIAKGGQIRIADVVYGGRFGNGRDNGDGFAYRGGGLIHLTFKNNYQLCSIGINEPQLLTNPSLIVEPDIAVRSALWFWKRNNCSRPANFGDFEQVCIIINGGRNGMADRQAIHAKAWNTIF